MVCIYCGGKTQVINSRNQKRSNQVWRRRRCLACNSVITTEERTRYESALMVGYPDSPLQPFSRDVLLISLHKSLAHRKQAIEDAAALTDTVIALLRQHQQAEGSPTIDKYVLTTYVSTVLERFDATSAAHYRAYHADQ